MWSEERSRYQWKNKDPRTRRWRFRIWYERECFNFINNVIISTNSLINSILICHTGEYPWQVAILKKDTTESVYVCGGTLISARHILTAAHCVKTYKGRDLRARLGEWDVNHDVEFFPYIERDIVSVYVHPEFYAGTLYNDVAILQLDHDVDFSKNPHISPACLPSKFEDFTGHRYILIQCLKFSFANQYFLSFENLSIIFLM